jgi:hypothetical protein
MGLVQYHQVDFDVLAPVHRVIQLVAKNFRGAHDYRRMRIFLPVAREYPHVFRTEDLAEFMVLRIRQRLKRRSIPTFAAPSKNLVNGLDGDICFSRSRWRGNQYVGLVDEAQRLDLKRIRGEGSRFGRAYAIQHGAQTPVDLQGERTDCGLDRRPASIMS